MIESRKQKSIVVMGDRNPATKKGYFREVCNQQCLSIREVEVFATEVPGWAIDKINSVLKRSPGDIIDKAGHSLFAVFVATIHRYRPELRFFWASYVKDAFTIT